MSSLLFLDFYHPIINAEPVLFFSSNVQQEMEYPIGVRLSVKLSELYIVQSITSGMLYYYYQCKTLYFHFSNVQQEMEFQIGSTLPIKSCKIASLSYTSRAISCALYLPLEFYIIIINAKPVHLIIPFPM